MKKVAKRFDGRGEVSGIQFTQLKREGIVCLYERSDGYYEVITLKAQKESTGIFNGVKVHFEAKEIYPSGDSWKGKCVRSKKYAIELYQNMVRGAKRSEFSDTFSLERY